VSRILRLARWRSDTAGIQLTWLSRIQIDWRTATACFAVTCLLPLSGCGGSSVPVAQDAARNPPAGLMPAGGVDGGAPADAGMPGDAGGEMPGDAGGAAADAAAAGGDASGDEAEPKIAERPKDIADWKEDDYRNAAKAGDPRLAKAVEHYASATEDKAQVAKFFEELLAIKPVAGAAQDGSYAAPGDGSAPGELSTPDATGCSEEPADAGAAAEGGPGQMPGEGEYYAEQTAGGEQTAAARAMLAWLVANPTPETRRVLERVLKAELQTMISHTAATRLILRGVLDTASDENASNESLELFWTALTDPKKYIATATPARRRSDESGVDPAADPNVLTDDSNQAPLTRDSLQQIALQLLNSKRLPALRTRLAEHIVKDSTSKEQKNILGAALLQPRVENLSAQLVLYANPKTSAAARSRFERYFRTYSAEGIDRLLRIPSGSTGADPNAPGGDGGPALSDAASADGAMPGDGALPGGSLDDPGLDSAGDSRPRLTAWDEDEQQMYQDLARLWDQQFIAAVEKRLTGLRTMSQELELLRLAVSLPATPVRVALHKLVQKDWQTGPAALKEAGVFAQEIHDPGLMLVIKAVPREQDTRTAAAKQAASWLRGATEKAVKERETKAAWLGANYDFLRALNRRFYAAATNRDRPAPPREEPGKEKPKDSSDLFSLVAGPWHDLGLLSPPLLGGLLIADPPAAADPSALPLRLLPDATIVAEYHVNWPADLEDKLEGTKIEPLALHYVRIEQEGRLQSIAGTYTRQLSPVASYTPPGGMWLDAQDKGASPGHKRSFDVLILPESAHRSDNQAGDGSNAEAGNAGASEPPANPRAAAIARNAPKKYVVEILTIEVPDPTQ